MEKTIITVENTINAPIEKVWQYWNEPKHIMQWNSASPDWHSPSAANDLRVGGSFSYRMEARDGSMGFDFAGTYDAVKEHELMEYTMGDGRRVQNLFNTKGNQVHLVVNFDAETENPIDMQRFGWQSILDSFKKYVETTA